MGGSVTGVVEHGNSAVLVTISDQRAVIDRRTVQLTSNLPTHPYHHQGSWAVGRYKESPWYKDISLDEAIALVRQVGEACRIGAIEALKALSSDVSSPITAISIRECPILPDTIDGRIRDNRAQAQADTVMYRKAMANAAQDMGWSVHYYEKDSVFQAAQDAVGCEDIHHFIKDLGKSVGPPWQAKHKLAAASALAVMDF